MTRRPWFLAGGALLLVGVAVGVRYAVQAPATTVRVILTSADLVQRLTTMPSLHFSARRPSDLPILSVDDAVQDQTMLGFGAAMTDSSAWLLYEQLSPQARQIAFAKLYGPSGLRLNFARVPMGASDFSVGGRPYTYDDLPAGDLDVSLRHFSTAHDDAYILPALALMRAVNPAVRVLATPWTPPAWMKANDRTDDLGLSGRILPAYYGALADYFVRFIRAYARAGIPIWGVTPENEPQSPAGYPAASLSATAEGQFVSADLAPALSALGSGVRIYGGDVGSNNTAYANQLEATPAARDLAGMAFHCGGGQQGMSAFHAAHPRVQELETECSPGILTYSTAEAVIDASRNWASAFLLWNVALDPEHGPVQAPDVGCRGCQGAITVDPSTHTATYTANYYELGQVSEFVRPGAVRVQTPRWVRDIKPPGGRYGVSPGVDNVAFVNPDGSHVLVAHNSAAGAVRFAIQWRGGYVSYSLSAGATVTFTWR